MIFPELMLKITHRKEQLLRCTSPSSHPLTVLNLPGAMTTMEVLIRATNLYFNHYVKIQQNCQMVNVTQERASRLGLKVDNSNAILGLEI